ncbi:hypothetical protein A2926_00720 [Candidatus Giovannonibacteria bacterium RIFCSPLOWO2_01_FULL_44_40]|uniref:Uncharacterized protein n=1 Tax=Candidatus Giovannonibacteria bacterium RIFCSPHIGHO2_01_FULL_45_23 TaxID=1798325 RepID=A0A1F5VEQ0_9BACT|nr:MAG: hypothetical protein A2834_00225 [Candidatus Giovannonibacteria bacterium RIFCSPHIGHO2_01_FULL_45_23]OGF76475.1 MAG: hypothetical protein A3C77_02935 [Candidatus Giovannonibacteria bacterium RIFCSPHIGHO2_02_FULL_45_13]OGF79602.1 MAG: hypothetical protein A2926_00720 [Candidatus Giovannonibacteria bacterium RIFCSPLOWO2_01_FULL_44_40]
MATLTIPPSLIKEQELVIIPKKAYEDLLKIRNAKIKEVEMTSLQKKTLLQMRQNLAKGKFLTTHELRRKLGIER